MTAGSDGVDRQRTATDGEDSAASVAGGGETQERLGWIARVADDVPDVESAGSIERVTAGVGVLAREQDLTGVAKDTVGARGVPQLVDRDERVSDRRDAADVADEQLPEGAGAVTGDDGHVSHERRRVESFVDALDFVRAGTVINEVACVWVHVPRTAAIDDKGESDREGGKPP